MAIRSAYVITEEQDGFVAVDFVDGYGEEDRHELTAWELVDGESDDVSEGVEFSGSDVSSECCAETIVGEDVESLPEFFSENVGFADLIGEDAKSVTELTLSPEYAEETIAGESRMLPEYIPEKIADYSDSVAACRSRSEKYCYEEEDEAEEDDYDLDDELVPYYVNSKLGRERMRKLGKRSSTKSLKSKRLTYNYNKAGCFRGKHGLGLKHSLI